MAKNNQKSAVTVLPYTAVEGIEQIIQEHQGPAVDVLPEGWTQEEVDAHILSAEALEMDKQLAAQGLAMVALPKETRETAENLIVPAGPLGKERWFIKKNLASFTKMDDGNGFWVIASKRQLKDRGLAV